MTAREDLIRRSKVLSERIRQRTDVKIRKIIDDFSDPLDYTARSDLMISPSAWEHVTRSGIEPRQVFAHPELLQQHPEASLYYRGLSLLPQKRMRAAGAVDVKNWENNSLARPVSRESATTVCRLYNSVISSIIEGSVEWTLDNGYRNIMNSIGITLDGMFRNVIGQDAERLIKTKVEDWLREQKLIEERKSQGRFVLSGGVTMIYGSDPDILFMRAARPIATIEIKGGKDPAGALERLGAMQKSFDATPAGCQNILIAGVVTPQMQVRLEQIGVIKVFILDNLLNDDEWNDFTKEVFHHTLRVL